MDFDAIKRLEELNNPVEPWTSTDDGIVKQGLEEFMVHVEELGWPSYVVHYIRMSLMARGAAKAISIERQL